MVVFVFQAEYEEARKELQIEVAQGVSIDKIRARLQGGQVKYKNPYRNNPPTYNEPKPVSI